MLLPALAMPNSATFSLDYALGDAIKHPASPVEQLKFYHAADSQEPSQMRLEFGA